MADKALGYYQLYHDPQVISFTAPTGSGKTVIMCALIENILCGMDDSPEQPNAIFVWLSDSPSLNQQSKEKIETFSDRIRRNQLEVIEESSFDRETLEDGHIYFLNTQKLGKNSRLVNYSDDRQHTIWDTLRNTAEQKSDRLYFIIDEAHRGATGNELGKATSIMQRFIKGRPQDGLNPMPVVIGMSATIERFNKLVTGISRSIHPVSVDINEVRRSGLLKDRIILTYPPEANSDMTILQAAADEWKKNSDHWEQYCRIKKGTVVKPLLLIQVQNTSNNSVTETDLREAIRTVQDRTGKEFEDGEIVHTFGTKTDLSINGQIIRYAEPSSISDDRRIRMVFYKENLSTGWDCPRAEVMMSFRNVEDVTNIAQLLGRMIRTPLQHRIMNDDYLNEVYVFLPHFNERNVRYVVKALQDAEGGELPTYIETEEAGNSGNGYWTTPQRRTPTVLPGQTNILDLPGTGIMPVGPETGEPTQPGTPQPIPRPDPPARPVTPHPQPAPVQPPVPQPTPEPATPAQPEPGNEPFQTSMQAVIIDRNEIREEINRAGLLTHEISTTQIKEKYISSLNELTSLLLITGIAPTAAHEVETHIVDMIWQYIQELKRLYVYEEKCNAVMQMQLSQQIFDAFGNSIDNYQIHGAYMTSDAELDRQLRMADRKLGGTTISAAYRNAHDNEENPDAPAIEVILFANDESCMENLGEYAKNRFYELDNEYRLQFNRTSEYYRIKHNTIVSQADIISKHALFLPETPGRFDDPHGKRYDNHLFINPETGYANISLNGWEEAIIKKVSDRPDFVCWLRNVSRARWAMRIPYEFEGTKAAYPDFIIVRNVENVGYVFDILEPHAQNLADGLAKAKGYAKAIKDNPREYERVGHVEMIRTTQDAAGQWRFTGIDLMNGQTQEKVFLAQTFEEYSHIYITDGHYY